MLTLYSASWCSHCQPLRAQLDRERIEYQLIDIDNDPEAAKYVMGVNGGEQTVPTVRFPDGSTLTNPTVHAIRARLIRLALGN